MVIADEDGGSQVIVDATQDGAELTLRRGSVVTKIRVEDQQTSMQLYDGANEPQVALTARSDMALLRLAQGDVGLSLKTTDSRASFDMVKGASQAQIVVDSGGASLTVRDGTAQSVLESRGDTARLRCAGPGGTATLGTTPGAVAVNIEGAGESAGIARLEAGEGGRQLLLSHEDEVLRMGVAPDGTPFVVQEGGDGRRRWAPTAAADPP